MGPWPRVLGKHSAPTETSGREPGGRRPSAGRPPGEIIAALCFPSSWKDKRGKRRWTTANSLPLVQVWVVVLVSQTHRQLCSEGLSHPVYKFLGPSASVCLWGRKAVTGTEAEGLAEESSVENPLPCCQVWGLRTSRAGAFPPGSPCLPALQTSGTQAGPFTVGLFSLERKNAGILP